MAARKPVVGGNWKCNPGTLLAAGKLIAAWKDTEFDKAKIDVYICPTALHLGPVKEDLESIGMIAASQNVSATGFGAFTGEHAAEHLVDLGVGWTLVGHSERRSKYGDTDEETAKKVERCQEKDLMCVLCIGESLEEREAGKTNEVNMRQLNACIPVIKNWDKIVIAYEPVWAIGTGKVATPDQAQETQQAIRQFIAENVSGEIAEKVRIQYGGSVSPENCAELISKPDIDGFLVGGASMKPTFMEIVSKTQAAAP